MGQQAINQSASPQHIGPQDLWRLRTVHEVLARDFGMALSALLRTPTDVSLVSVDQLTYGQFVYNIETPACFHILKAEALDDRAMLDIETSILHPMLDRLLGGAGEDGPLPGRPLTEIEWCLTARIVRLFLQECRTAWQNICDLKLDVLQTESNPRLLRVLPADEMMILIGFRLAMGDRQGTLRFCLPSRAIERLGNKLSSQGPAPVGRPGASELAEVRVTLAETPIAAADLADLRVGDVIATETPADSPALVSIDGAVMFRAKPGVCQGRKAVRIGEALENADQSGPHPSSPA